MSHLPGSTSPDKSMEPTGASRSDHFQVVPQGPLAPVAHAQHSTET
jgi:hypothetical protein